LLGLRGLVFKSHGSSDSFAFEHALRAHTTRRRTACSTASSSGSRRRSRRFPRPAIRASPRRSTTRRRSAESSRHERRFASALLAHPRHGSYLPPDRVTNADLAARLAKDGIETSDEWIVERTGIRSRHFAAPDVTSSDLALVAAQRALEAADCDPRAIDLIVFATSTPDMVFPSAACLLQQKLGVAGCPAFDVQAVCSGFVYALTVADSMIKTGAASRALVVGAEVFSRILDFKDRTTCVLFGDGAGAVVLEASETPGSSPASCTPTAAMSASSAFPATCRAARSSAIRC
jgi:3-oxoacyl-[acyl-carrier-protein] synthase III